jgi:hypothetical protein
MIIDTGENISISHRKSDLLILSAEELRDLQDLEIIRAELYRKLARVTEDNPNSIVGTVEKNLCRCSKIISMTRSLKLTAKKDHLATTCLCTETEETQTKASLSSID